MKKRFVAVCIVVFALATSLTPARAADQTYAQGPGGPYAGYTVPVIVVRPGDAVTFLNLDAFQHDVIAGDHSIPLIGPDQTWCADAGFAPGNCPLIWSALIGLGKTSVIQGLGALHPGDIISFTCSIHASMNGKLVVVPA